MRKVQEMTEMKKAWWWGVAGLNNCQSALKQMSEYLPDLLWDLLPDWILLLISSDRHKMFMCVTSAHWELWDTGTAAGCCGGFESNKIHWNADISLCIYSTNKTGTKNLIVHGTDEFLLLEEMFVERPQILFEKENFMWWC
jgi:hypothetical protein